MHEPGKLALKVLRGVPYDPQLSTDLFRVSCTASLFPSATGVMRNMKINGLVSVLQKLLNRIKEWRKLTHKNVLPVYGIATDLSIMPCIVMPLCPKGNATELPSNMNKLRLVSSYACSSYASFMNLNRLIVIPIS